MKNKPYKVTGDQQNGFRIAVPTETGVKKGDRYDFHKCEESGMKFLPYGALVYVPVPVIRPSPGTTTLIIRHPGGGNGGSGKVKK